MGFYVCKTCGRALQSEQQPNFCYADRMDTVEGISDADAQRYGAFTFGGSFMQDGLLYEFPRDVRFHPITGEEFHVSPYGKASLSAMQQTLMQRVVR